jgi:xanthine/uracil permease
VVGAAFGGLGTTSYPENIGIIRITRIGSRFVTLAAGVFAIVLSLFPKLALFIAALPGPVLGAASTILFGIIAVSGIQILNRVEWDELNLAVAAPSFIISLGTMFLPADIVALLPNSVASIVTQPMMVGVIMLVVLNTLINMVIRPRLAGAGVVKGAVA